MENNKAVGLQLDGQKIYATKEIILSAGVYNTPVILLKSGIGPASTIDLPVGDGLMEQPYYQMTFALKLLSKSQDNLCAFIWTKSSLAQNDDLDLQITSGISNTPSHGPVLTLGVAVTLVRSIGNVTINANGAPIINLNLFDANEDKRRMIEVIRLARQIVKTKPICDFIDHEISPGSSVQTDEQLLAHVYQNVGLFGHASATCRMNHVVDDQGRVIGVENLRICDTSIFPTIPSTLTHVTVLMCAERIAGMITYDSIDNNKTGKNFANNLGSK